MNNYNYINYDWYRNANMNYQNMNNNSNLFNPKDGFEKGNMFSNLYSEYKNYKPINPKINNDRERLLNDISSICFASHELNLYLDIHPEDQSMISLFNDYKMKEKELISEFENKYGPLTTNSIMKNPFSWEEEKWPWEVE